MMRLSGSVKLRYALASILYEDRSLKFKVFIALDAPLGSHQRCWLSHAAGGEGGIRTPDTVTRMPHFECGAFNRSATSPAEGRRRRPSYGVRRITCEGH